MTASPMHLEGELFLRINRAYWDVKTVNGLIHDNNKS